MTPEEKIQLLKEQVKLYRFDWLTGLKQRRDFDFELRHKFKTEPSFYLCYYDVDNLHRTNREKGFAEGDRLIRQVAEDIQHQPIPHTTYRTSGDELYSICCKTPTEEVDNATMVSLHTKGYISIEEVLEQLDKLMIEAKTKKKTRRIDDLI